MDLNRQLITAIDQVSAMAAALPERSWYLTAQFGRLIDRSAFCVREWAREGRIAARKRPTGRGRRCEWEIHISELQKYRDHGLLPSTGESPSPAYGSVPASEHETGGTPRTYLDQDCAGLSSKSPFNL